MNHIKTESAFFKWIKKYSENYHYTDVSDVYNWTKVDRKLSKAESIAQFINIMRNDKYYSARHYRKVHKAYDFYLDRIIGRV